ncbi:uncharacterized protein RHO25_008569 [Cercospora beticola]|uniref:Fucose-specific lectin n=1 Tax=Cercospora beticola TaxID=122368 RepID=A0ABZ0NWQ1_CERBT|nr:hypothetical protein RHO25_008569 [Cercospora beticola]CAK1357287.1 unnamed protein product [Cercospora beticola]
MLRFLFLAIASAAIVAAWVSDPIALTVWPGIKERIDLFGLTADAKHVWHKFHNEHGWEPAVFESLSKPDATLSAEKSTPVAVSWGDNRIDLFVVAEDGKPYHRWWSGSQWEPKKWAPLWNEEEESAIAFRSKLSVTSWGPSRIDLVGHDSNGTYLHKYFDGHSWSVWENLWPDQSFTSPPAITSWGINRFDIFGTTEDGIVLHQAWVGDRYFEQWEKLPNPQSHNFRPHAQLTATSGGVGLLSIYAIGRNDSALYYTSWGPGFYNAWQNLGGTFDASAPKVLRRSASWVDIVGFAEKEAMDFDYKIWSGSDWQPGAQKWWKLGGGQFSGQPQVASWSERTLAVFGLGTEGELKWRFYWGEDWTDWIVLGDTKEWKSSAAGWDGQQVLGAKKEI